MKNYTKKLTAILLSFIMLFSVLASVTVTADAAGNSFGAATALKLNSSVWGEFSSSNPSDFYSITLPTSGRLDLTVNAFLRWTSYELYDSNFKKMWYDNYGRWDDTTKVFVKTWSWELLSGTYYFVAKRADTYTGEYQIKTKFESSGESFKESVDIQYNSYSGARKIDLNKTYKGHLSENDSADFYTFTLPSSGRIALNVNACLGNSQYEIYDSNFDIVWKSAPNNFWNSSTQMLVKTWTIDFVAGKYYLIIKSTATGKYNFSTKFTAAKENFKESVDSKRNNTFDTASAIKCCSRYYGQLAENDSVDYYKFSLSKKVTIKVNVVSKIAYNRNSIYDKSFNKVWSESSGWNSNAGETTMNKEVTLAKGTYYFVVEPGSDKSGVYNFLITDPTVPSKVTLSKSKITLGVKQTYKLTSKVSSSKAPQTVSWSTSNKKVATVDKNGKITAKATGTAKITAKTANGKSAVCTVTVKKAPAKVALSKKSVTLKKGKAYTLKASITKGSVTSYKWTTSNKKIVTVNSKGKITAKKKGTAKITVTTHNGKKATCKITVK